MKNLKIAALALTTTILSQGAYALPTGGTVTNGTATIVQTGKTLDINQISSRADINWKTFGAANKETINFNQPGANSITINRVTGGQRSVFANGSAVNAPGTVVILNEAGLTISKGAQFNVGAVIGSTAKDYEIIGNRLSLSNLGKGTIVNNANIKTNSDGYLVFVGNNVQNTGDIDVGKGTISLASAPSAVVFTDNGDVGFTQYEDTPKLAGTGITSTGHLTADIVAIRTKQVPNYAGAINLSGIIDTSSDFGRLDVSSSGNLTSKAQVYFPKGGDIQTSASGTNTFAGTYTGSIVELSGKDVVYKGSIVSGGKYSRVGITSENGLTIANGARPAAPAKNTLYQNDLQNITNTAETTYVSTQGDLTIKDLKDNLLDAHNEIALRGNNVKALDKNDTINSQNGRAFISASKDIDIGEVSANKGVYLSSSSGNINATRLTSMDRIDVTTYGKGDINVGALNVAHYTTGANLNDSGVIVSSQGGNVKTGNINVSTGMTNYTDVPATISSNVYVGSTPDYLSGKAGDVSVGDIFASSRYYGNPTKTTGGGSQVNVTLNGYNVSSNHIEVDADSLSSRLATVSVKETATNKLTQLGDIYASARSSSSGLVNVELESKGLKIDSGNKKIDDRIIAKSINNTTGVTTTRYPSNSLVQVSVKQPQ